jgi:hypothetical protein
MSGEGAQFDHVTFSACGRRAPVLRAGTTHEIVHAHDFMRPEYAPPSSSMETRCAIKPAGTTRPCNIPATFILHIGELPKTFPECPRGDDLNTDMRNPSAFGFAFR